MKLNSDLTFSPNLVGEVARTVIPANPALESWLLTTKGTAAPLGQFTYVSHVMVHMGLDGKPLSLTDGVGAFTGVDNRRQPTGDAIFFTLSGVFQPATTEKPNVVPFDAVFIVTGGTGRFAGAVGSGRIQASAGIQKNEFVGAWDGITKILGG